MIRTVHQTRLHAVASPYRDRSHFDGQNVLESGGTAPYEHIYLPAVRSGQFIEPRL